MSFKTYRGAVVLAVFAAVSAAAPSAAPSAAAAKQSFIGHLGAIATIASTVPTSGPANGDQNPYGVAVVPRSVGKLVRGDVLISNFNNAKNQQGTGSSIMELSRSGHVKVFALVPRPHGSPAVGLTTALVVLRSGYVIVGSLPAPGGVAGAARAGALTVLNANGRVVETITGGGINGPWDMTAVDRGTSAVLFVTNVLNGTVAAAGKVAHGATVVRITLDIRPGHVPVAISDRLIAKGFAEHTDPAALVVGPTGVGLGPNGVLYVADSNGSRIAAIPNALTRTHALGNGGKTVTSKGAINDPLGLAIAPNGDVLTVNGGDGNIVETTPTGHQLATKTLIANGAGALFGLAVAPGHRGLYFVNDSGSGPAANSLQRLH